MIATIVISVGLLALLALALRRVFKKKGGCECASSCEPSACAHCPGCASAGQSASTGTNAGVKR